MVLTEKSLASPSLMDGCMGSVAYLFSAGNLYGDQLAAQKGVDIICDVFDYYNNQHGDNHKISFGYGITGFCYIVNKFRDNSYLSDLFEDDFLTQIDVVIADFTYRQIDLCSFGFINGAAGNTYYLFKRALYNQSYKAVLENIIQKFADAAIHDKDGLRYSSGDLHKTWTVKGYSSHYNMSLSDGLTGMLLIFTHIYEALGNIANIREIISEGVKFLLGLERPVSFSERNFCFFPTIVSDNRNIRNHKTEFYNSRLGWCIGDLPVAFLLCKAGAVLNELEWAAKGASVAKFTLQRKSLVSTKVDNYAFCHGSAGIASLYKGIYEITGDRDFFTAGYAFWAADLKNNLERAGNTQLGLLNGDLAQLLVYTEHCGIQIESWKDIFLL